MYVECDVCGENYEVDDPSEDEEFIGHVCDRCRAESQGDAEVEQD